MLPKTRSTSYRILYADTDQMGVVYYGNYNRFYEMGRSEFVREEGFPYKRLEEQGIVMPVFSVEAKYRYPLRYDEQIRIETTVSEVPQVRMAFGHKIYNEEGGLAHEAKVVLAFLDRQTKRPVRAPEALRKLIAGL
ncbi:MAG: thioesterase [Bacteroidetes bacterium]|nr:MAG: thioesterase [Bacteroidota bacterium]